MLNGKFKLSIEENAIFICDYIVFKAKTLSKLVKNGRKYLSLMLDSQKEKYIFHLWGDSCPRGTLVQGGSYLGRQLSRGTNVGGTNVRGTLVRRTNVTTSFNGVSRVTKGSFQEVSRKFQKLFKKVSLVF